MTQTVHAEILKIGDTILPPAREIQLWMRRYCQERGLAESAMHLIVTGIDEGTPDKRGRWLFVRTRQTAEWCADLVDPDPAKHPFTFKARPQTPWPLIA
jgi:hypothetical protein